jgi:hypothetical protein
MDISVDRLVINFFFVLKKWKSDSISYGRKYGTFEVCDG